MSYRVALRLRDLYSKRADLRRLLKDRYREKQTYTDRQKIKSVDIIKRQPEPSRRRSHRDAMLEEMGWLATDVYQERRWKIVVARDLAVLAALEARRRGFACDIDATNRTHVLKAKKQQQQAQAQVVPGGQTNEPSDNAAAAHSDAAMDVDAAAASSSSSAAAAAAVAHAEQLAAVDTIRRRCVMAAAAVSKVMAAAPHDVDPATTAAAQVPASDKDATAKATRVCWALMRRACFAAAATSAVGTSSASASSIATAAAAGRAVPPSALFPFSNTKTQEISYFRPLGVEDTAQYIYQRNAASNGTSAGAAGGGDGTASGFTSPAGSSPLPTTRHLLAVSSAIAGAAEAWIHDGQGSLLTSMLGKQGTGSASSSSSAFSKLRSPQETTAARVVAAWLCGAPAVIEGFPTAHGLGRRTVATACIAAAHAWAAAAGRGGPGSASLVLCAPAHLQRWVAAVQRWCPGVQPVVISAVEQLHHLPPSASSQPLVLMVPVSAASVVLPYMLQSRIRLVSMVLDQRGLTVEEDADKAAAAAASASAGEGAPSSSAPSPPTRLTVQSVMRDLVASCSSNPAVVSALINAPRLLITAESIPFGEHAYLSDLTQWMLPQAFPSAAAVTAWSVSAHRRQVIREKEKAKAREIEAHGGVLPAWMEAKAAAAAAAGSAAAAAGVVPAVEKAQVLPGAGSSADASAPGGDAIDVDMLGSDSNKAAAPSDAAATSSSSTSSAAVPSSSPLPPQPSLDDQEQDMPALTDNQVLNATMDAINKAIGLLYVSIAHVEPPVDPTAPAALAKAAVTTGPASLAVPQRTDRLVHAPLTPPQLLMQARLVRAHYACAIAASGAGSIDAGAVAAVSTQLSVPMRRARHAAGRAQPDEATDASSAAQALQMASSAHPLLLGLIAALHCASQHSDLLPMSADLPLPADARGRILDLLSDRQPLLAPASGQAVVAVPRVSDAYARGIQRCGVRIDGVVKPKAVSSLLQRGDRGISGIASVSGCGITVASVTLAALHPGPASSKSASGSAGSSSSSGASSSAKLTSSTTCNALLLSQHIGRRVPRQSIKDWQPFSTVTPAAAQAAASSAPGAGCRIEVRALAVAKAIVDYQRKAEAAEARRAGAGAGASSGKGSGSASMTAASFFGGAGSSKKSKQQPPQPQPAHDDADQQRDNALTTWLTSSTPVSATRVELSSPSLSALVGHPFGSGSRIGGKKVALALSSQAPASSEAGYGLSAVTAPQPVCLWARSPSAASAPSSVPAAYQAVVGRSGTSAGWSWLRVAGPNAVSGMTGVGWTAPVLVGSGSASSVVDGYATSLLPPVQSPALTAHRMLLRSSKLKAVSAIMAECTVFGQRPLFLCHSVVTASLVHRYLCASGVPCVRLDGIEDASALGGWSSAAVNRLNSCQRVVAAGVACTAAPGWLLELACQPGAFADGKNTVGGSPIAPSPQLQTAIHAFLCQDIDGRAVDVAVMVDQPFATPLQTSASVPLTSAQHQPPVSMPALLAETVLHRLRMQRPLLAIHIVGLGGFEEPPPHPQQQQAGGHGGDALTALSRAAPTTMLVPRLDIDVSPAAGAAASSASSLSPLNVVSSLLAVRAGEAAAAAIASSAAVAPSRPLDPAQRRDLSYVGRGLQRRLKQVRAARQALPSSTAVASVLGKRRANNSSSGPNRVSSAATSSSSVRAWSYTIPNEDLDEAADDEEELAMYGPADTVTGRLTLKQHQHAGHPKQRPRARRRLPATVRAAIDVLARHQDAGGIHFSHTYGPPHYEQKMVSTATAMTSDSAAQSTTRQAALLPLNFFASFHPHETFQGRKEVVPKYATRAPIRDVPWRHKPGLPQAKAYPPNAAGGNRPPTAPRPNVGQAISAGIPPGMSGINQQPIMPRPGNQSAIAAGAVAGPDPLLPSNLAFTAFHRGSGLIYDGPNRIQTLAPSSREVVAPDDGHAMRAAQAAHNAVLEAKAAAEQAAATAAKLKAATEAAEKAVAESAAAAGLTADVSMSDAASSSTAAAAAAGDAMVVDGALAQSPSADGAPAAGAAGASLISAGAEAGAAASSLESVPLESAAPSAHAHASPSSAVVPPPVVSPPAAPSLGPADIERRKTMEEEAITEYGAWPFDRVARIADNARALIAARRQFMSKQYEQTLLYKHRYSDVLGLYFTAPEREVKRAKLQLGVVGDDSSVGAQELLNLARADVQPVQPKVFDTNRDQDWTTVEDIVLLRAVAQYGINWAVVQDCLRAQVADQLLPPQMAYVHLHGKRGQTRENQPTSLARVRPVRSARQCYERFSRLVSKSMTLRAHVPQAPGMEAVNNMLRTLTSAKKHRLQGQGMFVGVPNMLNRPPPDRILTMRTHRVLDPKLRRVRDPSYAFTALSTGEAVVLDGPLRPKAIVAMAGQDATKPGPVTYAHSIRTKSTQQRTVQEHLEQTHLLHQFQDPSAVPPPLQMSIPDTATAAEIDPQWLQEAYSRGHIRSGEAIHALRAPSVAVPMIAVPIGAIHAANAAGIGTANQPVTIPSFAPSYNPRPDPFRISSHFVANYKASIAQQIMAQQQAVMAQQQAVQQQQHQQQQMRAQQQQHMRAQQQQHQANALLLQQQQQLEISFARIVTDYLLRIADVVGKTQEEMSEWLHKELNAAEKSQIVNIYTHQQFAQFDETAKDAMVAEILANKLS